MSARRKKRPRSGQRTTRERLAARDGHTVRVKACCALDVTIGFPRLTVRHDDGCRALHPDTVAGYAARMQANAAVAGLMDRLQFGPTVVVVAGTPPGVKA